LEKLEQTCTSFLLTSHLQAIVRLGRFQIASSINRVFCVSLFSRVSRLYSVEDVSIVVIFWHDYASNKNMDKKKIQFL
jgi:hypothetical protein